MLTLYLVLLEDRSDEAAFLTLYNQYKERFFHRAFTILQDAYWAEDAVHDAFISMAKNFKKILAIPQEEQGAYLVIIVDNKCRDILRKEKKYVLVPEILPKEADDELDEARGTYRRTMELIGEMEDSTREVLERRLVLEMTNKETAQIMGLSEKAVSRRYTAAIDALREQLEREGYRYG